MNKLEEFQAWVSFYKQRLGLEQWQIWVTQEEVNTVPAETYILWVEKQAWIRLSQRDFPSDGPVEQATHVEFPSCLKELAAHELIHIFVATWAQYTKILADDEAKQEMGKLLEEELVCNLTKVLCQSS